MDANTVLENEEVKEENDQGFLVRAFANASFVFEDDELDSDEELILEDQEEKEQE